MRRLRITMNLQVALVLGMVVGCVDHPGPEEAVAIKKNYVEFRSAMALKDYDIAANFISSEIVALYTNREEMLRLFTTITNEDYELKKDGWVKFNWDGTSISYLFPHGAPVVGRGFVKET